MTGEPEEHQPMGRLEAIEIGPRKLTIQTEFFARPSARAETKVYLGGALKKVYTESLDGLTLPEMQSALDRFHTAKRDEIVAGLRRLAGE